MINIFCLSSSKPFFSSTGKTISVGSVFSLFFPPTYWNGCIGIIHLYTNIIFIHSRDHRALTPGYLKPLQFLCVDKPHNFQHLEIHPSEFLWFGLSQTWRASQNSPSWNIVTKCRILSYRPTSEKQAEVTPRSHRPSKPTALLLLFHTADLELYLLQLVSPSLLSLRSLLCSVWRSWVIIHVLISVSGCLTCKLNSRNKRLNSEWHFLAKKIQNSALPWPSYRLVSSPYEKLEHIRLPLLEDAKIPSQQGQNYPNLHCFLLFWKSESSPNSSKPLPQALIH